MTVTAPRSGSLGEDGSLDDRGGVVTNAGLLQRHRAVSPSFVAQYYAEPLALDHGRGRHVWDVEGTRYLDFFGGVLTTLAGHDVPEISDAIAAQARKIIHSSTLYLSEPMIELAEMITELSGIPDARVFLTPSGTEANDSALLLATQYRRSNQVLAMRNSYHGRSFGTVAITSHKSWTPTSISGLDVHFVQGPYRLRSPFRDLDDDGYTRACVADLVQLLDMVSAGSPAALIAEPIQGVGGFAVPPAGFFGAMKKELDNQGILFISDEVQTGWGRTGEHFWGYQAHGIVPDILTFAKGVGNGLALAGVVARAEIFDAVSGYFFSTFGGNPLVAAGGVANLRYLLDHDLQGNAKVMGERFRARLRTVCEETPWIAELRGTGLMWAIEAVHPGGIEPDAARAARLLEEAKARHLLIGKGGLYGNILRLAPPMSITADEVDEAADALVGAIRAIA